MAQAIDELNPEEVRDFRALTARQAQKCFDWYLGQIPACVDALEAACAGHAVLDKTPESLGPLWLWARQIIKGKEVSHQDVAQSKQLASAFMDEAQRKGAVLGQKQIESTFKSFEPAGQLLSDSDKVLCKNIGFYFAAILMRRNPGVQWGTEKKGTEKNKPQLYLAPPRGAFEPFNIIEVIALRELKGKGAESALMDLFNMYEGNISEYQNRRD